MPSPANALLQDIALRARRGLSTLIRLQRLLVYGIYLLLWSKVFLGRPRPLLAPLEQALLKLKSVEHLPPELTTKDLQDRLSSWSQGFAAIHAALFMNLKPADRLASGGRHAHPAPSFRAVYLWDSAFIAQVWKWWDPETGWDVLRAVIDLRDGDRLQHFAADFARSPFTQPPLIAWSLDELGRIADPGQSEKWMRYAYDPLRSYLDWLNHHRRLPNGLFAWAHPYESGVENAPRFSSRDERRLADTRNLAAPDFSTYMVLNGEALARMARRIGRDEDAEAIERETDALRALVNSELWDDEEGLYFDRNVKTGAFVRSRTISSLLPLWAGIPSREQAERLCKHVLDPQAFNTVIPLPSVSLRDPDFEKDMWRGPVWLNTAFAVIAGLRRYGFHEAAADLTFRLCDGVYRTFQHTGHFHEFYDPERHDIVELHRKRGNRWKRMTLGAKPVTDFVGWSGLVNVLVIEVLFGLGRTVGGLVMEPRFPSQAEGLRFELSLPRAELTAAISVGPQGRTEGHWVLSGRTHDFAASFGEPVHLG